MEVVCLDSSAIKADRYLRRSTVLRLRAYQQLWDVKVVIPAVVRREVEELIRDEATRERTNLAKAATALRGLSAHIEFDLPSELALAGAATEAFARRVLEIGAIEIPIPVVSHDAVLDRIQSRRRPFPVQGDGRDRGYKDFLLWESVRQYVSGITSISAVSLITGNHRDFAETEDLRSLHAHFREDLSPDLRTIIYPNMPTYLVEQVNKKIVSINAEQAGIWKAGDIGRLEEWLYDYAKDDMRGATPNDDFFNQEVGQFTMIDDVRSLHIDNVDELIVLDEDTAVMAVEVDLLVDVKTRGDGRWRNARELFAWLEYGPWTTNERIGAWGNFEVEFGMDSGQAVPVGAQLTYLSLTAGDSDSKG